MTEEAVGSATLLILVGLIAFSRASTNTVFSSLINTPSFMDRTMLVKSFLEDNNKRILVTTPPRSGKTTNLEMVRMFLEISVDENGNTEEVNTTSNYNLFKENQLNIFKHEELVERHFGKYPVMFINCRTLGNVLTFRELVMEFREILREVFTRHQYLLRHKHLWLDPLEVKHFKNFIDGKRTRKLNPTDMIKGLTYLAEILNGHFGRPVIVLLDDYDALEETINTNPNSEMEQITQFLKTLYTTLLKNNRFVDRALLTGVFKVAVANAPEFRYTMLPLSTVKYGYMDDLPVCKFFRHVFK